MSVETRSQTFRHSKDHFPEVENQLYNWIDAMRRTNLSVSPSLDLTKAKQIANELDDDDEMISAQNNKTDEQVLFSGFDTLYENIVALEDQILCKEFQGEAGEKYEKITSNISALQQLL